MNASQVQYARLNREKITRVHQLETKLNSWVVAVNLADLTEEKMQALKALEEELGVDLLAYKDGGAVPADLAEEELQGLKTLEEELDVILLAYKEDSA